MELEGVQIISERDRSNAAKCQRYRESNVERYRQRNASRMRKQREKAIPYFIGVDSEGIGKGNNHRAVLLSAYDKDGNGESYTAKDLDKGLQWQEVFSFLYSQFQSKKSAAFVGFYLGYDFNQWLKSLPLHAAHMLLSKKGRMQRKIHDPKGRRHSHPVRCNGWEMDMLGFKRLSIRPIVDGCVCGTPMIKCTATHAEWMHICDSGSFFQSTFVHTIDPKQWIHDNDGPVCTPEEYQRIKKNKEVRGVAALDAEMEYYNRLENIILCRVMERLAKGYLKIGVKLAKDQWYGPGAAAAKWLQHNGGIKRDKLVKKDGKLPRLIPRVFWNAAQASYYGGWFEIFSHGIIEGESYNYDINNAYPYAATKLPHICRECGWRSGKRAYRGNGNYVLLLATVRSKGDRIGAMPYRDKDGSILRPAITRGWYWKFEIDAARRAGLVEKVTTHEWTEFIPCSHPAPYKEIRDLYYQRLRVGKNSALGMAIKLTNNSIYGKFAQSVGGAPYNNWFYASYITAHCRSQILDAIATHPDKENAVLMVATDGILFDSPHPGIPISRELGEWEETTYTDALLFKPGVYTHKEGQEALLKVKSRGVPRKEFSEAIKAVEEEFRLYLGAQKAPNNVNDYFVTRYANSTWPSFYVPVKFRMKTCKQAINEGKWDTAGQVQEEVKLLQDSDPWRKRRTTRYNPIKNRFDSDIYSEFNLKNWPMDGIQSFYHGEIDWPKTADIGFSFEGSALDGVLQAASILRDKPANYDLPIDEIEWETVWGE